MFEIRRKKSVGEDNELVKEVKELQSKVDCLKKEREKLKEELAEITFKKRLEQEEIIHLQKLNEQRLKSEVETEKIAIQKKYQEDISTFKEENRKELVKSLKEFHTKIENRFNDELKNLKEVYGLLMKALPNVNFEITKHIGEPKFIEDKSKSKY